MDLKKEISACDLCRNELPFAPRPILQFHSASELLLVGQAPGLRAHESGIPWNDASGIRLREWLCVSEKDFYNPKKISIVPMGFCYPGKNKSGDLPPRKECQIRWMDSILSELKLVKKIILVGNHATTYFLGPGKLASQIREHANNDSPFVVLPHPSPRNFIWLNQNPWFEKEALMRIRNKLYRK